MKHFLMLAATATMLAATPAKADEVTDLIERGTYYFQLATSSLDLAKRVSARKEKCQWARQSRGELAQGLGYYETAQSRARTNPNWPADQRAKLDGVVERTRESLKQADQVVSQLC